MPDVVLRAGDARFRVSDGAPGLAAFAKAVNDAHRIAGLPDTLNPAMIDPGKLTALVAALPRLPAATRRRLAGRELFLGAGGLGVGTAEPTRPESFLQPFDLAVDSNSAPAVVARASITPDPALAQGRAGEAQAAALEADALAARQNRARTGPMTEAEGIVLVRRAAAARAWLVNARAWASAGGGPAAQSSLAAAEKAVKAFGMPAGAR